MHDRGARYSLIRKIRESCIEHDRIVERVSNLEELLQTKHDTTHTALETLEESPTSDKKRLVQDNDMDATNNESGIKYFLEERKFKTARYTRKTEQKKDKHHICTECGKNFKHLRSLKRHIETHIDGLTYACPICQKTARSSSALISHKNRYHK